MKTAWNSLFAQMNHSWEESTVTDSTIDASSEEMEAALTSLELADLKASQSVELRK